MDWKKIYVVYVVDWPLSRTRIGYRSAQDGDACSDIDSKVIGGVTDQRRAHTRLCIQTTAAHTRAGRYVTTTRARAGSHWPYLGDTDYENWIRTYHSLLRSRSAVHWTFNIYIIE